MEIALRNYLDFRERFHITLCILANKTRKKFRKIMNAVELTTGPIFPGIPCEPCFPFLPSKKKDYISSLTFSIFAKCSK